MVSVGVELDQCLGGLAVHRVADASRPDRPAVALEVAVGRLAVVGAQCGVYAGLRPPPKLLSGGEVERREAPPPIDPPEPGRSRDRLQRRRVVPRITFPVEPSTRTRFFLVLGPANVPAISNSHSPRRARCPTLSGPCPRAWARWACTCRSASRGPQVAHFGGVCRRVL